MSFITRDKAECPAACSAPPPLASLSFSLPNPNAITFRAPFASISLSPTTVRTEPHTSIAYPLEYCGLTTSKCPQLAGVGVRAKRLLGVKNINVYALGLYVDAQAAKRTLRKLKPPPGKEASQALFDAVVDADFERSLRLVISFGALKRGQFLSALEERLAPLMKQARAEGDLAAFKAQFSDVTIRKGLEIAFTAGSSGQLVTKVDGRRVGSIQSPALVQAVFSIYLGADPVSADAKTSFGQGLAALLHE